MPKQERAELTRATILDGAAHAFDTKGYLGASINDIINEAGVTKGALYFHFASKESLARAIIEEQFAVWEPLKGVDEPGVQTVIDLLHAMARNLQENVRVRASIRLVIEQGTFAQPDPGPYQTWIGVVRDCLAQAQARGEVRPELSVGDVARLIVGSWTGIQLSSEVLAGRADLRQRTTDLWGLLLPGLVPADQIPRLRPEGSPSVDQSGIQWAGPVRR